MVRGPGCTANKSDQVLAGYHGNPVTLRGSVEPTIPHLRGREGLRAKLSDREAEFTKQ